MSETIIDLLTSFISFIFGHFLIATVLGIFFLPIAYIFFIYRRSDKKIFGVLLGVIGVILWFTPFVEWKQEFMGEIISLHQTGQHIGGIAYLLPLSSFAYAVLSWFELHELRIIAAGVSMGISLLFLYQAGDKVAWGLITLIIVAGISLLAAILDDRRSKKYKERA